MISIIIVVREEEHAAPPGSPSVMTGDSEDEAGGGERGGGGRLVSAPLGIIIGGQGGVPKRSYESARKPLPATISCNTDDGP
jgi:hypothetical protein